MLVFPACYLVCRQRLSDILYVLIYRLVYTNVLRYHTHIKGESVETTTTKNILSKYGPWDPSGPFSQNITTPTSPPLHHHNHTPTRPLTFKQGPFSTPLPTRPLLTEEPPDARSKTRFTETLQGRFAPRQVWVSPELGGRARPIRLTGEASTGVKW